MACSPAPEPASTPTVTLAPPASVSPEARPSPPPPPGAIDQAAVHAEEARLRFETVARHPGLNAYSEFIKLPAAKYGTTQLYDLYKSKGPQALFEAVEGPAGEKLQPFIGEIYEVKSLLRYQYLAVPVEIPLSGAPVVSDDSKFVDVLKGVALAPILDLHSSSAEADYEPSTDYPILTLRVGRKVSFNASSLKHLELGVDLQMEALAVLDRLLKSRSLSIRQLQGLIVELQSLSGNDRDFLRVADGDYLLAVRRFEGLDLKPDEQARELRGLASRYLKHRALFVKHGPAPKDLGQPVPEAAGCEWVGKEKDLLGPYNRWRLATTRIAALELKAALELYRADKKQYPENLSELRKGYLTRLPLDLFSQDGKFAYKRDGDGYLLETRSDQIPGHRQGVYRW